MEVVPVLIHISKPVKPQSVDECSDWSPADSNTEYSDMNQLQVTLVYSNVRMDIIITPVKVNVLLKKFAEMVQ